MYNQAYVPHLIILTESGLPVPKTTPLQIKYLQSTVFSLHTV